LRVIPAEEAIILRSLRAEIDELSPYIDPIIASQLNKKINTRLLELLDEARDAKP
jgi:hypothetical protein